TSDGFFGYLIGPGIHSVDPNAISDPFLARLPGLPEWLPGHFVRRIPDGYLETVASGRNEIVEPSLAEYYGHLQLVTQGKLWSRGRLRDIWRFNTGRYEGLIEASSYGVQHLTLADLSQPRAEGSTSNAADVTRVRERGVEVDVGSVVG